MPTVPQGFSRAGVGNATAYMISGKPWMSGSAITGSTGYGEVAFQFPTVSRDVVVVNKGSVPLRVHLDTIANANVVQYHHFVTLDNKNDAIEFAVRLQSIYVSVTNAGHTGIVEVFAELTDAPIPQNDVLFVSGSGVNCTPT